MSGSCFVIDEGTAEVEQALGVEQDAHGESERGENGNASRLFVAEIDQVGAFLHAIAEGEIDRDDDTRPCAVAHRIRLEARRIDDGELWRFRRQR